MDDGFVDQYSVNLDAGIGTVHSCRYSKQKKHVQNNNFLSSYACINNGKIQLYGIFSGFNGGDAAAKFVMNRLVYEIFQDNPVTMSLSTTRIIEQLRKKFLNVAERYLMNNTDLLNERLLKLDENSESGSFKVSEINQKIRQGTTVLIVLKINQDIYVLNCGSSLALVITCEQAIQLNPNLHNKDNLLEKERILSLGIDPAEVLNPTRAIGDLQRTHLYEECKAFKNATGPPVISRPDVYHYRIDNTMQHLVLLSDGVVQNLKDIEVDDIPTEVFVRLSEDHTLTSTAQALADSFARKHLDAFLTMRDDKNCCISNQREEMTVIYVKLSDKNPELYETFDSALSTLESTNTPLFKHPSIPYIDAENFFCGKNFTLMKKLTFG